MSERLDVLVYATPLEPGECLRAVERALLGGRLSGATSLDQSSCWEWRGYRDEKGYGRLGVSGMTRRAHRVVYVALVGPIPEGLTIDHLCRNRSCVRPSHLEPVTNRTNSLRGASPIAAQVHRTHCPQGHPYTPENIRPWDAKRGVRGCATCACERSAELDALIGEARRALGLTRRAYGARYGWSRATAKSLIEAQS